MIHWLRWQFVVPRLLLCAVTLLGLQYALGVAARSIAMRQASSVFGSQVEVEKARVSLTDGHIVLAGVSVADPQFSLGKWLDAECCELEIAAAPLLNKRTIIDRGQISGARLSTPRPPTSHAAKWVADDRVEEISQRLKNLDGGLHPDVVQQLESVKRTEALCVRFPSQLAELRKRAAAFERRTSSLEEAIDSAAANRLRHESHLNDVPAQITDLREEVRVLHADFEKLPQQLEEERRAIVAARRQDHQILRDRLRMESFDHTSLNAYLLHQQVAQSLDELVGCLQNIRQVVPANAKPQQGRMRGEDVVFAGLRPTPDVFIRALQVRGETCIMGQNVELHGVVRDLSNKPAFHDAPIQVRLSATGSSPIELRATIDRTGGRVRDELIVDCREIPIGGQSLGRVGEFQLNLDQSVGSVLVSLNVEGDKLAGNIQLVQKNVRMATSLGGDTSRIPLDASLNATLGEVNSFATRIQLAGTIDKPTCTLWSNLGPAVAEARAQASERHSDERVRIVLAETRRQVDEQLADLDRQVASEQAAFATKMAALPGRIDAIARQQTRRERLSVEQLGRRLPNNSLFR